MNSLTYQRMVNEFIKNLLAMTCPELWSRGVNFRGSVLDGLA